MEDKLKILKVEYLINHLLNDTQILNLILDDQTIFYKSLNEDNDDQKKNNKFLHLGRRKFVGYHYLSVENLTN